GNSRPDCRIVAVEPDVADCLRTSLAADAPTTVPTGETSMAGLNCGTPSYLAWPDLKRGLAGAVVVDDAAAADAINGPPARRRREPGRIARPCHRTGTFTSRPVAGLVGDAAQHRRLRRGRVGRRHRPGKRAAPPMMCATGAI